MTDHLQVGPKLRRAVPRQPADWFGFFRFDDSENTAWRCCRVVDISPLGAGLELFGITEDDHTDGPVTVSLELRGSPRNVNFDVDSHSARVGIEFAQPSDAARRYLRMMSGVRSRW
jgi:hypothetical protein